MGKIPILTNNFQWVRTTTNIYIYMYIILYILSHASHVPLKFRFLYVCRSPVEFFRGLKAPRFWRFDWTTGGSLQTSSCFNKLLEMIDPTWKSHPPLSLSPKKCIYTLFLLVECSVPFGDEIQDLFIIWVYLRFSQPWKSNSLRTRNDEWCSWSWVISNVHSYLGVSQIEITPISSIMEFRMAFPVSPFIFYRRIPTF